MTLLVFWWILNVTPLPHSLATDATFVCVCGGDGGDGGGGEEKKKQRTLKNENIPFLTRDLSEQRSCCLPLTEALPNHRWILMEPFPWIHQSVCI